ncbi:hypothetical protein D1Y84_10700 [Acidipila sp. EB88]|nr:hypothetical protein D1Y84_10700 [Acidipila sp. EB88]
MESGWKFPEQQALAQQAEAMLQIGDDHESVLRFLRNGGLSKIDSMRVLSQATGIPLLKARDIVQSSQAWR